MWEGSSAISPPTRGGGGGTRSNAEYDDEVDTELLSVSASNNTVPYAFVGVSGSGNDEVGIVFERATWG